MPKNYVIIFAETYNKSVFIFIYTRSLKYLNNYFTGVDRPGTDQCC